MGFLKFGLIRSSLPRTTLLSTLKCKTRKCIWQDAHNQPIYNCAYSLLYYLRWTLIFYRSIFCALNLQNVKTDELSKDLHTEIKWSNQVSDWRRYEDYSRKLLLILPWGFAMPTRKHLLWIENGKRSCKEDSIWRYLMIGWEIKRCYAGVGWVLKENGK